MEFHLDLSMATQKNPRTQDPQENLHLLVSCFRPREMCFLRIQKTYIDTKVEREKKRGTPQK